MMSEASLVPGVTARGGVGIEHTSELSFNQEQIWLDEQITPGTAAYNMPIICELKGFLDVDGLERCLGELVRRHGKSCGRLSRPWITGRSRSSGRMSSSSSPGSISPVGVRRIGKRR